MSFEIVDGMTGTKHISSDDLAALNTATVGKADCVLEYGDDFALTMASANSATLGTGVAMVMTADSKNKDGVYDFFKYWNSTEAQVKWSLDVGYPLTNTTVSSDSRLAANPNIAAFSDAGEYAHFYLQQLTCFSEIDADIITPAIEEILLTDADVQEVLDRAAEQMDALTGN